MLSLFVSYFLNAIITYGSGPSCWGGYDKPTIGLPRYPSRGVIATTKYPDHTTYKWTSPSRSLVSPSHTRTLAIDLLCTSSPGMHTSQVCSQHIRCPFVHIAHTCHRPYCFILFLLLLLLLHELETILAFKANRLQSFLDKHRPDTVIIKDISTSEEPSLRQKHYQHLKYTSWGLSDALENLSTVTSSVQHKKTGLQCRAYTDEPLHLARELVAEACGREAVSVHYSDTYSRPVEYKEWTISGDPSLTGISKSEVVQVLADRIGSIQEAEEWDSWGVELVSPPYTDVERAQTDTAAIVSAIRGSAGNDFGAVSSKHCGLHIHVGQPDGCPLPLKTLQNLAYLVVVYEEEIDKLHEPQRRQAETEITTNRENFYAECADPVERLVYNPESQTRQVKKFEPIYKALSEIRGAIFDTVNNAADPILRLIPLMGRHKGRKVNFSALSQLGRPSTVEFRQHAGTLDTKAVYWWAQFCTSLVRLADRYARTEGECPVRDWDDRICVENLFEEMGFAQEGRDFFRARMETFAGLEDIPEPVGYWREYEEFGDDFLEDEACFA